MGDRRPKCDILGTREFLNSGNVWKHVCQRHEVWNTRHLSTRIKVLSSERSSVGIFHTKKLAQCLFVLLSDLLSD